MELLQGDGVRTPQTIKASIERGALHVFGAEIPLPIRCLAGRPPSRASGSTLVPVAYASSLSPITTIMV